MCVYIYIYIYIYDICTFVYICMDYMSSLLTIDDNALKMINTSNLLLLPSSLDVHQLLLTNKLEFHINNKLIEFCNTSLVLGLV